VDRLKWTALSGLLAGTLCRIDDINPESNMKIPVERAEDWLYLCAIFSDAGVIDEELNSVVPPSRKFEILYLLSAVILQSHVAQTK